MDIKSSKTISIVIPVYNEILVIDKLMEELEGFRDICEIIFVDGGSRDGTDSRIKESYKLLYSPKKGRANQMNYGASKSKGDILLFLHADSCLPIGGISEIKNIIDSGKKAGCFRIKFNSQSMLMKICALLSNLRVRLRNIAFGDQGIFIDREYFYKLGAFPDLPLMEDYKLSMDIKADGERIALAGTRISTSDRRFRENGRLRTIVRMQRLQYMYRRGEDIGKISRLYK